MSPASVLIIDDDTRFRESLEDFLTNEGLVADYAADWDEGVGAFRVGLHELVIADFNLPDSAHGLQLLAAVKPLRPSSRLVLISGALLPEAEELISHLALVDAYYVKGGSLYAQLQGEIEQAATISLARSEWPAIAAAHRSATEMDPQELERIDALLKLQLTAP